MLFAKLAHRWIAVVMCVLLSGCTVCKNAKRTLIAEPKAFSSKKDRVYSKKLYRSWANRAWKEHCAAVPEMRGANNYGAGFKDGFVDFVYAGGPGEPPPVPPRRFWNTDIRSPGGHNGANQWFEGYRDGARFAREGGFREQAIIQSSFRSGFMNESATPQYPEFSTAPYEIEPTPFEELSPPPVETTPLQLEGPLPLERKLLKSELLKNEMPLGSSTDRQPLMPSELRLASSGNRIALGGAKAPALMGESALNPQRLNPFRTQEKVQNKNQ